MRRALAALLLAALLPAAPGASAAEPAARPGALERLAQAVAEEVRAQGPQLPLALHLSSASPELRRAFATLLAARLADARLAPVVLTAPSPEQAEAVARQQGAATLVRLTLTLDSGELRARGDMLGTWSNFWSGRTPSRPSAPAAALARTTEADPQALALAAMEPPPPAPATAPSAPRPLRLLGAALARLPWPLAALAAGDLNGDGRDEVAALGERELAVFAADGRLLARHSLDSLPLSPTPTREPFGTLAILPAPPRLAAFSSRYAQGELLALAGTALTPVGRLDSPLPGADLSAAFLPGQTALAPELRLGSGRTLTAPAPATTASLAPPWLLLVHMEGSASLLPLAGGAAVRLGGLGAGSALGDLDGDGTPELLTTSPELRPMPDVLRVLPLQGAESAAPLWQGPLPVGRALQVVSADLEGDRRREVVVGLTRPDSTSELYLLRQGAP